MTDSACISPIFMSEKHIFRFFLLTAPIRWAEYRDNSWEVNYSESVGLHSFGYNFETSIAGTNVKNGR
jgi:hypothetical protein